MKFWVRIRRNLEKNSDEPGEAGCLNWQGAVGNNGYGRKTVIWTYEGQSEVGVHRLARILAHDLLREDMPEVNPRGQVLDVVHICQEIVHDLTHLVLEEQSEPMPPQEPKFQVSLARARRSRK